MKKVKLTLFIRRRWEHLNTFTRLRILKKFVKYFYSELTEASVVFLEYLMSGRGVYRHWTRFTAKLWAINMYVIHTYTLKIYSWDIWQTARKKHSTFHLYTLHTLSKDVRKANVRIVHAQIVTSHFEVHKKLLSGTRVKEKETLARSWSCCCVSTCKLYYLYTTLHFLLIHNIFFIIQSLYFYRATFDIKKVVLMRHTKWLLMRLSKVASSR